MAQRSLTFLFGTALFYYGLALAFEPAADAQRRETTRAVLPPCMAVSTSAPYSGYGYNHVVTLTSTCPQRYLCQVTTNANPTPTLVRVAANSSASVRTLVGSPAREFTPTVSCTVER